MCCELEWFVQPGVAAAGPRAAIKAAAPCGWRPPGPRQLWEEAVLFVPDTPEGVLSVPRLTAQWSADPAWLASKRAAMAELWRRYGPEGFIGDIEWLYSVASTRDWTNMGGITQH